ncbi:Nucleolar protein 16, partial [Nowakowskiella sp. JEL0078]
SRKQRNPQNISFAGAPAIVQKHWDKKLTLKENYANLGLVSSLDGSAGGVENVLVGRTIDEIAEFNALAQNETPVDLIEVDTEEFSPLENISKIEVSNIGSKVQLLTRPGRKITKSLPKKPVIRTLIIDEMEEMAKNEIKVERYISEYEGLWMDKLLQAHGNDYDKMAMDINRNTYQLTKSQLKKKIEMHLKKGK